MKFPIIPLELYYSKIDDLSLFYNIGSDLKIEKILNF